MDLPQVLLLAVAIALQDQEQHLLRLRREAIVNPEPDHLLTTIRALHPNTSTQDGAIELIMTEFVENTRDLTLEDMVTIQLANRQSKNAV